ncbi:MAG TPA: isocitrate lyase/phosphoenolpyruvate mutase family protein [Acidimicrobiia bacterium]|nr:isocitrate lyase/phosphoenolpyruvate mutase family protein [Acidimicrobiia bacterium]
MPTDRSATIDDLRRRFAELHESGHFVIPNPWDLGSARLLEALGFQALATTSSGLAAALGKLDQSLDFEELEAHVTSLVAAVGVPVSVDAENGYGSDPAAVAENVARLAQAGAAGVSIEDYDPDSGLYSPSEAAERVAAAAEVCRSTGMVLTARAENHLYGVDDLDDTIARLDAYREAGADVVYAPRLSRIDDIRRVVDEVGAPLNVLLTPDCPPIGEMAAVGVRRFSTGGALAFASYGSMVEAAQELLAGGERSYHSRVLAPDVRQRAFVGRSA